MQNANGGEPNLYASLDMIPEIGTNGSIQRLNDTKKGPLHHELCQKRSKMVRNCQNYRKWGKNFQIFENFL